MKLVTQVLLVCLVLGIAFAILFPIFAAHRGGGRDATLRSSKLITLGQLLYAYDHDDLHTPDALRATTAETQSARRHQQCLNLYLRRPAIWTEASGVTPPSDAQTIGMAPEVSAFTTVGDFWMKYKLANSDMVHANLGTFAEPESEPIYRENVWRTPNSAGQFEVRSGSGICVSYSDGHVTRLPLLKFLSSVIVL